MDWLLILGVLAFGGLIIGWMGYTTITDSLIKDQKREIRKLKNENRKLKAAISGSRVIKSIEIYTDPWRCQNCEVEAAERRYMENDSEE